MIYGLIHNQSFAFRGAGYLAGASPSGDDDGRTKILNVPERVRVCVFERRTMRCVWSGWSAPDGTWRADYLSDKLKYFVIGFDGTGLVNAAIQDWITPHVPGP